MCRDKKSCWLYRNLVSTRRALFKWALVMPEMRIHRRTGSVSIFTEKVIRDSNSGWGVVTRAHRGSPLHGQLNTTSHMWRTHICGILQSHTLSSVNWFPPPLRKGDSRIPQKWLVAFAAAELPLQFILLVAFFQEKTQLVACLNFVKIAFATVLFDWVIG